MFAFNYICEILLLQLWNILTLYVQSRMDNPATHGIKTKSKKTQHKMKYIRPTKIKVLVLGQRRPLKISADGTFLLPYRKKIAAVPYFWRFFFFKFTAKFKFSSVPVTRTSFDKRLNDWSMENESKNSAWLRVKTHSISRVVVPATLHNISVNAHFTRFL